MASKKEKQEDKGSSVSSGADDFSFDDVPILGGGKGGADFSFEEMPETPVPVRKTERSKESPSVLSLEKILLNETTPDSAITEEKTALPEEENQKQPLTIKWDAFLRRANFAGNKKLIILVSGGTLGILILFGIVVFFVLPIFSKGRSSEAKQPLAEKTATTEQQKSPSAETAPLAKQQTQEQPKMDTSKEKLKKVQELLQDKKYTEALQILEEMESTVSNSSEICLRKAQCMIGMDKKTEALKLLENSLAFLDPPKETYIEIIGLLNSMGRSTETVDLIEELKKKFPDDISSLPVIAESLFLRNETEAALDTFLKCQRQDLNERQIRIFASLNEKKSPKDAVQLLIYAGKKFQSVSAFLDAARIQQKPADKLSVLQEGEISIKDEAKKSVISLNIGELLLKMGKKEEAVSSLCVVDPAALNHAELKTYVKLISDAGMTASLKHQLPIIAEKNYEDIPLMREILSRITSSDFDEVKKSVFENLMVQKKDATSEFLYGLALGNSSISKPYFESALRKNPMFGEAWIELGNAYMRERDWKNAIETFKKGLKYSDNLDARRNLAYAEIYSGKAEEAIKDYEKYLIEKGKTNTEIALELLPLSENLDSPEMSAKFLQIILSDEKLKNRHAGLKIRNKLIYSNLSDDDFTEGYPGELREYYQIYLLSQGREKELLSMLTPPNKFPEFWKVFVCWRINKHGWKENAEQIASKALASGNTTQAMIASLWLDKTTADDLRAIAGKIPFEDEPLFYFMLAMKYRKDGNATSARVCFNAALRHKYSPLKTLIQYYASKTNIQ